MFREYVQRLSAVERLDRIVDTKDIQIGEVDDGAGGSLLAVRLPSTEILTLEERAKAQLGSPWSIPGAHPERLT